MRERRINLFLRYSPEIINAVKGLTGVSENVIEDAIKNLLVARGLYASEDAEVVSEEVVEIAEEEEKKVESVFTEENKEKAERKDESLSRWVVVE